MKKSHDYISEQVAQLRSLFASGELIHPYLGREYFSEGNSDAIVDSFVDLSASIAMCCGAPMHTIEEVHHSNTNISEIRNQLASEIGGKPTKNARGKTIYPRKHIVLILCDGMGTSCLQNAFASENKPSSFFIVNNQPSRLRAVFPSTTPAALTTLATASWPGRHGMPGWNLRDKSGCDFPGNADPAHPAVQLLVLSDRVRDARSEELASNLGFDNWDKVFVEVPWSRGLLESKDTRPNSSATRKMIYINAYLGDDYQNWSQGGSSGGTDFSSWQMGNNDAEHTNNYYASLFNTAKIEETAYDTLGDPKGSIDAINYFRSGLDAALSKITEAERYGEFTFTYLYTAHPDKHMHELGVENTEVKNVIQGLDYEVKRFWEKLGNKDDLLAGSFSDTNATKNKDINNVITPVDATVVITSDHGHITVEPKHMVLLPQNILECLEYANIGVHGKVSTKCSNITTSTHYFHTELSCCQGRHGYLHCKTGLQNLLLERWQSHDELCANFLIITVEKATENGLFGPQCMRHEVRPRLGDFIVISKGRHTLVTPTEADRYISSCRCQGAHGSLLPEEMNIPFILLSRS